MLSLSPAAGGVLIGEMEDEEYEEVKRTGVRALSREFIRTERGHYQEPSAELSNRP